jgi:hypothetical protein
MSHQLDQSAKDCIAACNDCATECGNCFAHMAGKESKKSGSIPSLIYIEPGPLFLGYARRRRRTAFIPVATQMKSQRPTYSSAI